MPQLYSDGLLDITFYGQRYSQKFNRPSTGYYTHADSEQISIFAHHGVVYTCANLGTDASFRSASRHASAISPVDESLPPGDYGMILR